MAITSWYAFHCPQEYPHGQPCPATASHLIRLTVQLVEKRCSEDQGHHRVTEADRLLAMLRQVKDTIRAISATSSASEGPPEPHSAMAGAPIYSAESRGVGAFRGSFLRVEVRLQ